MPRNSLVVRTKLIPPRPGKRTLRRERLTRRLMEAQDYRLTILQAGAGYGKSTALACLAESGLPLAWYHLDPEDADPILFLLHLVSSFQRLDPEGNESLLNLISNWQSQPGSFQYVEIIDRLVNALSERLGSSTLLILDDVHHISDAAHTLQLLDRFINLAPADLHTILSTRSQPKLPNLVNWRVKGEVLTIGQEELTFTPQEIIELYHNHYGLQLSALELQNLVASTEGWAIALQLYWQHLRGAHPGAAPGRLLESAASEDLFPYLAQEVLHQQAPNVRQFLLQTAVLQELSAELCDRIRQADDSQQIMRYLVENGLFAIELDAGHLRYHPLFREFLLCQMTTAERQAAHHSAAVCYLNSGRPDLAVTHLLSAGEAQAAATHLEGISESMIREGRLDLLETQVSSLPPDVLEAHPLLLSRLGDIARLRSRFDEAFAWYRQAEDHSRAQRDIQGLSQALHGLARVYLDTVNPSQAEHVLEEVLRITDGYEDRESRARLLILMAENRLNQGKPEEAEKYQAMAQEIRNSGPSEAELSTRVLLRTGRLQEALTRLEEQARLEQRDPVLTPRSHRETYLLLSLIQSFQGEGDLALHNALEGIRRGKDLSSPFVSAVGYMRQGHARQVQDDAGSFAEACACYQEAIHISEILSVPRLKVEAYWGLCRAYGFHGELAAAENSAQAGAELARRAGDEWIRALICVSMGAGYLLHRQYEPGLEWLTQAMLAFENCSDTFGETVTHLWQCLAWYELGDLSRLELGVVELLRAATQHQYEFLFTRKSLLGPPDLRRLAPLLIFARDHSPCASEARQILTSLGLAEAELHPGYQLRVQSLGTFRVWRGEVEISSGEWKREKARQLFQLLLTFRKTLLEREQITELLWPDLDPETAQRDFKVALSSLIKVLEPDHEKDAPSAYIAREGHSYGLRKGADLYLDAVEFERLINEGDKLYTLDLGRAMASYWTALKLYQGEYFQECPYQDWCSVERERLLALYLRVADRLAHSLAEQQKWEEAIELCQDILRRDNCWEEAHRLTMLAYAALGMEAQALRAWQKCVESLSRELGAEPSEETREVYASLFGADPKHG